MKKYMFIYSILLLIIFTTNSFSQVIHFIKNGGDDGNTGLSWAQAFATISHAVTSASEGDEILVGYDAPGTMYSITGCITVNKNLKITSAQVNIDVDFDSAIPDSSKCIIDAGGNCRIFTIDGSSTAITNSTIIRGFTIQNGKATHESRMPRLGGGVLIYYSYPIIERCYIYYNTASHERTSDFTDDIGYGGGIAVYNSGTETHAIIRYCRIKANSASTSNVQWSTHYSYGGGIYVDANDAPIISFNKIHENISSVRGIGHGGGICTYSYNNFDINSKPQILNNDIYSNAAATIGLSETGAMGGGIYVEVDGGMIIKNNLIRDNKATTTSWTSSSGSGGGIYFYQMDVLSVIANNTFYKNANCDKAGVGGTGSGIYTNSVNGTFKNNIFSNQDVINSDQRAFAYIGSESLTISYNCFFGNGTNTYSSSGTVTSNNQVLTDPQFVDVNTNDFSLRASSDCIDTGDPSYLAPDGGEPIIDIGAIEYINTEVNNVNNVGNMSFINGTAIAIEAQTGSINAQVQQFLNPPSNTPIGCRHIDKYWDVSSITGGNAKIRLYFTQEACAAFTGTPTIYHYTGSAWESLPTSIVTNTGTCKYVETQNYYSSFSSVTVGDGDAPLPVELTSFTAKIKNSAGISDVVYLQWQTATEVNNYGFSIERKSSIENSEWETLGFVEGAGNSNSPKGYSFVDASSPLNASSISYRLKQIDFDGKFEYSKEIEIEFKIISYSLEQNYPNPFNPSTTIRYQISEVGMVTLKIYDILGREVKTLVKDFKTKGHYEVTFDAGCLASGLYIYEIKSGDYKASKKMTLIK